MNLKHLHKLRKAKKEMLPGVERAIMRLAESVPDLVKALNKMAKAIDGFTKKTPIDNVDTETPIKLDDSCTCHGKGWDFFEEDDTKRIVLQRCDMCQKYGSDQAVAVAIDPLLQRFAAWAARRDQC